MNDMIKDQPLFAYIWASYTLVGLLYPVLVTSKLRRTPEDARRWIKNNPTFNVHQVFIFPLATAILFSSGEFFNFPTEPEKRLISVTVLVALILLSLFAVLDDLRRPAVEPYLFKNSSEPLAAEAKSRETLVAMRKRLRGGDFPDKKALKLALEKFADDRARLNAEYQAIARPFLTLRGMVARGSQCAYGALLLNAVGAVTIAIFFWHFFNFGVFREQINSNSVSLATGLFLLWLPMRLYAEWYTNFYSLRHLASYWAFLFILFASILSCVFLLIANSRQPIKWISVFSAALIVVTALIGKFKPDWLQIVADVIEDMPFRWYVAFLGLFVIGFLGIVAGLMGVA